MITSNNPDEKKQKILTESVKYKYKLGGMCQTSGERSLG
jgi:hypothetical protein